MAKENQVLSKTLKVKSKQKRPNREKGSPSTPAPNENKAPSAGSNGEPSSSSSASAPRPSSSAGTARSSSPSQCAWAVAEVQGMMHGFGDCPKPLLESAKLVEEIVGRQMTSLYLQAADLAAARGSKCVGVEEVLFLMRKDKVRLRRLINYLEVKFFQGMVLSAPGEDDIATETTLVTPDTVVGIEEVKPCAAPRPKRTKLCLDFINSIDQTGELAAVFGDSIFDDVKHERYLRAEAQTRCMDQAQYFEYSNARRSSFCAKQKSARFRDWLMKDIDSDIKPSGSVLEVFNYLAYETVAQIVDLALLVKKDAKSCPGDPMSWSMPPAVFNTGFPCVQIPSNQERQTPLSSEATPARAESSTGSTLAEMECITPNEIREAIRRYWKHRGPLACFMVS
ncbi:unnamed protein product, partial [Ixodes hexagonus]